jgi:hypothetical protein
MRLQPALALCIALGASQIASAGLPFSGQAFATVQATIDFCSRAAPKDASRYQDRARALVQGLPAEEVAKARDSDEYKSTYEETSSALGKLTKRQVDDACHGLLDAQG